MRGASSFSETAVSVTGASVRRGWVCRVRLRSCSVSCWGSMRSLLSCRIEGGTGTEYQNRTPKIKILTPFNCVLKYLINEI